METVEELTAFLNETTADNYRGRLQARGEARALIRRDGVLPPDSPGFAEGIDIDLAEYGFSILRGSLALRELGGDATIWRRGFVRAGNTFEALVQNGAPNAVSRGFHRVIGAASYHLANYSALAFSLIVENSGDRNLAPAEEALARLITRDLLGLRTLTRTWLLDPSHSDADIAQSAEAGQTDPDDIIRVVGTTTMFRALSFFEFALQTGAVELVEEARGLIHRATALAKRANAVSLWWIFRIAQNLIDDLWASSLHRVLPHEGPPGSEETYAPLRRMFIGELYCRPAAEVELWPSQLEAAERAVNMADDLVVALPTSAGKTRIAELATLMALTCNRRVLIVTPLRALSAQTERTFRRTFSPLGYSVSSLYGASGVAGTDEDALRQQNIVIATPEKLDFALRNDPTIIDDVGLIVLDEGHLIGPSEREIRYENLVQRLLRREDNANRRIVCLSAILPEGDHLNDLTAWIRSDIAGSPIQANWRPTRQRFGTLAWLGSSARLSFDLEAEGPFIRHFIPESPPIAPRRTPFPKNNKELTLAAAWKFSEQGKRTLIFCTQRDHVESFAEATIDLHRRGFLPHLLDGQQSIQRALAVGREWLGADHPAIRCLELGVAIHHARLPGPFLRELESLLGSGILRVTVASPTLAQGLNLNAAVMLIPNLYRAGVLISGEEFANVAGRAGRAFVDLEGLVVHVMREPEAWRHNTWRELVNSARARSLASGIIAVVDQVIQRLAASNVFSREDAMAYLSNSQEAWFPQDEPGETGSMESLIERLDATVLGLVEALDANSADLPRLLDEALTGSLWARQIARFAGERRVQQMWILIARAQLIWNKSTAEQRKSQFAMGVGLESGLAIDAMSAELTALLDAADGAAWGGDAVGLATALIGLAERLLLIRPFAPDDGLLDGWQNLLRAWIRGDDVATIGIDNMRVVDDAFVYRLVWAIEAVRMHRRAYGGESETIEGSAAACLETGLPKQTMAMLVRAGLPSRVAAQAVIGQLQPVMTTRRDMIHWLRSPEVEVLSDQPEWPTTETQAIWMRFRSEALADSVGQWSFQEWSLDMPQGINIDALHPARIAIDSHSGRVSITTADHKAIINIQQRLDQRLPSVFHVDFSPDGRQAHIKRMGHGSARWVQDQ